MKKILLPITLLAVTFLTGCVGGPKLVCKSDEGNITIYYNDTSITGYTANGMTYDLEEQQAYASKVGIEAYIEEFDIWFKTNTTGSCEIIESE